MKRYDQARLNVIGQLLGHEKSKCFRGPDIFVLVDHMFDQPDKYGFNGNAIRFTEDLANAISRSCWGDWEWLMENEDRKPDDAAYALIWPLAKQAVLDILASKYGQDVIEAEVEYLRQEDEETYAALAER